MTKSDSLLYLDPNQEIDMMAEINQLVITIVIIKQPRNNAK
jgi:hypothetical protein